MRHATRRAGGLLSDVGKQCEFCLFEFDPGCDGHAGVRAFDHQTLRHGNSPFAELMVFYFGEILALPSVGLAPINLGIACPAHFLSQGAEHPENQTQRHALFQGISRGLDAQRNCRQSVRRHHIGMTIDRGCCISNRQD
jgi:hypothetical protein